MSLLSDYYKKSPINLNKSTPSSLGALSGRFEINDFGIPQMKKKPVIAMKQPITINKKQSVEQPIKLSSRPQMTPMPITQGPLPQTATALSSGNDPLQHTLNLIRDARNRSQGQSQPMMNEPMYNEPVYDMPGYSLSKTSMPEYNIPTGSPSPSGYMIDEYAKSWEQNPDASSQELLYQGNNLNDVRNKIATGITDPYNLGVKSNIPFTADQLRGIERGMAESIDPAINDLKSRILSRQKEENSSSSYSTGGLFSGLDDFTKRAISNQQNQFDALDTTKSLRKLGTSIGSIMAIDPTTKNPAQHQAIIYEFAKALDPESVVREGEYATIKKYSQGLADRYRGEIKQAVKGNGFLSESAIRSIQQAAQTKYNSLLNQSKEISRGYVRQLNESYGLTLPDDIMINYEVSANPDFNQSEIDGNNVPQYRRLPNGTYEVLTNVGSGTNKAPKVVAGYDISSYATDPNHERKVATIYQRTPQFRTASDIDSVIKTVAPKSRITGQMVATASSKYGVDPKMVYAIMLQDSSLGTAGMGARNNNPGNIGQFDNLGRPVAGYQTLQGGVDAVAKWLAKKKVNQSNSNYA